MLFVCGKNRWRSPTAEQIFAERSDCEVRSAGLAPESDTPLSDELVEWADRIFVMEPKHRSLVKRRHRAVLGSKRIICLRIADRYRFMDPDLIALLKQRMASHWP